MLTYTSSGRPLVLETSLSADTVLVAGMQGHEAISELFHFRLDSRIPRPMLMSFEKVLGQPAALTCRLPGGERLFSGILSRIEQHDQDEVFTSYPAELVLSTACSTRNKKRQL